MTSAAKSVACAVALVAIATAPAAAQLSLPRPPGVHIADVSRPEERGSEPGIAVNPRNPAHVVGTYQGPARVVYSTDSARTFATAAGTAPSDWRVAGDVSIAFDDAGAAYLSYLTFDRLGTPSYWRHAAGRNGVWVRRSPDGGKTWDATPSPVRVWNTDSEPGMQYEDMPRVFADNNASSPHAGNVYMGWIEWQIDKSIMLFARSMDHGRTWSTPLRISTQAGFPRDDNGDVVGFHGVVGADGTIYAIWNWGLNIMLATSRDGGKSFSPSRVVQQVGPPYFGGTGAVPGLGRVFGFPQVGVYRDNVYLCWSDFRNGDIDVFVAASRDGGRTWSKPVRATTDSLHSGRDQFLQFMAVDPMNGDVYVQFYDRRDDPQDRLTTFTLARSTDGGRTFTDYAWNDAPFEGRNAFLGDYTWLTAYDGRVYGIWAESVPMEPSSTGAPVRAGTVIRIGTADFGRASRR